MNVKRAAIGGWFICVLSVTTLAVSASQSGVRHAPLTCLVENYSTASGNGVFARVGGFSCMVLLSPDGTHWACQNSGTSSSLYAIAFGNGRFVAVGNEGAVVTSADGASWKVVNAGTEERLRSIVFAKGMFVAAGYNGAIVTSRNGLVWKVRNSGSDDRLHGVTFGNDRFVAISKNGQIISSANGKKWNRLTALAGTFRAISYEEGTFSAKTGEGRILTSVDGLTWNSLPELPMIASTERSARNAEAP